MDGITYDYGFVLSFFKSGLGFIYLQKKTKQQIIMPKDWSIIERYKHVTNL